MSYRTYINVNGKSFQFLGNNEYCLGLANYLQSLGCEIDGDGCYSSFEITDIGAIIKIVEDYILEEVENTRKIYGKDIFNIKPSERTEKIGLSFTENMWDMKENAIVFLSANLLQFLIECKCISMEHIFDGRKIIETRYGILEGYKITINAS